MNVFSTKISIAACVAVFCISDANVAPTSVVARMLRGARRADQKKTRVGRFSIMDLPKEGNAADSRNALHSLTGEELNQFLPPTDVATASTEPIDLLSTFLDAPASVAKLVDVSDVVEEEPVAASESAKLIDVDSVEVDLFEQAANARDDDHDLFGDMLLDGLERTTSKVLAGRMKEETRALSKRSPFEIQKSEAQAKAFRTLSGGNDGVITLNTLSRWLKTAGRAAGKTRMGSVAVMWAQMATLDDQAKRLFQMMETYTVSGRKEVDTLEFRTFCENVFFTEENNGVSSQYNPEYARNCLATDASDKLAEVMLKQFALIATGKADL